MAQLPNERFHRKPDNPQDVNAETEHLEAPFTREMLDSRNMIYYTGKDEDRVPHSIMGEPRARLESLPEEVAVMVKVTFPDGRWKELKVVSIDTHLGATGHRYNFSEEDTRGFQPMEQMGGDGSLYKFVFNQ